MDDRFEIAHGAYRLRESKCFVKSAGNLRGTTCHDPHDIPRRPDAIGVCESCHAAAIQAAAAPYHGEGISYYPAPLADTPENSLYVAAAQVRDGRSLDKGLPQSTSLLDRYHPAQAGFYTELGQGYRGSEVNSGDSLF
jgi:hypothetical protein